MITLAIAVAAVAQDAAAVLVITEPWVSYAPGSRNAEAYVRLRSSEAATLVGARSDEVARIDMRPGGSSRATLHEIALPPGTTVLLAPGADRFVLRGLDRPRELGSYVSLVLSFIGADRQVQEIEVRAEVRRHSPAYDHLHGHHH